MTYEFQSVRVGDRNVSVRLAPAGFPWAYHVIYIFGAHMVTVSDRLSRRARRRAIIKAVKYRGAATLLGGRFPDSEVRS